MAFYRRRPRPDAEKCADPAKARASALETLAPLLAQATQPGGRIALSGILQGQEQAVLQRYAPWFDDLSVVSDGDWVRIDGVRKQAGRE